ncbi:MAG: hypothetical protein ACE5I9_00220 [Candidatus Methylomirabilales bacterium]
MIPGFNTDFSCRQQTYHIQTEDLGREDPSILTLVYRTGAVVAQVKTNYRELLGPDPSPQAVQALMTRQHRQVIADIRAGKIDSGQGKDLFNLVSEYLADDSKSGEER